MVPAKIHHTHQFVPVEEAEADPAELICSLKMMEVAEVAHVLLRYLPDFALPCLDPLREYAELGKDKTLADFPLLVPFVVKYGEKLYSLLFTFFPFVVMIGTAFGAKGVFGVPEYSTELYSQFLIFVVYIKFSVF